MMPIGSLLSGVLAKSDVLGPRYTTVSGGLVALVAAAVFSLRLPAVRRELRPIYIRRGILSGPGCAVGAGLGHGGGIRTLSVARARGRRGRGAIYSPTRIRDDEGVRVPLGMYD